MTQPEVEHVVSRDGTRIGFLRQGRGPGIVLVQGAMADVTAYRDLAAALSSSWTVLSAERRGRGLSPRPYTADHELARDVEDVDAILRATAATTVFGLSSGAVIALEAARTLDRVQRTIVYEPPFYEQGISRDGIDGLNQEIEDGDWSSALVDALLIAGTAPATVRRSPRWLARALARAVLTVDAWRGSGRTTLRELLPGVRYDFHDVATVDGQLAQFSLIQRPVLVLSGTSSPAFLRAAAARLLRVLPDAEHVEFAGLGHDGPWNDGRPAAVAAAVNAFARAKE